MNGCEVCTEKERLSKTSSGMLQLAWHWREAPWFLTQSQWFFMIVGLTPCSVSHPLQTQPWKLVVTALLHGSLIQKPSS